MGRNANPLQEDSDDDGAGDICDTNTDPDNDGIDDGVDNLPERCKSRAGRSR